MSGEEGFILECWIPTLLVVEGSKHHPRIVHEAGRELGGYIAAVASGEYIVTEDRDEATVFFFTDTEGSVADYLRGEGEDIELVRTFISAPPNPAL